LLQNKEEADAAGLQEIASRHASAVAFEILAKLDTLSAPQHMTLGPSTGQSGYSSQATSTAQGGAEPFEIFFSYVKEDERLVKRLQTQLAILKQRRLITDWHAGRIVPGQDPVVETMKHLNSARVILLIISPSFTASKRHAIEVKRAMERSDQGEAIIVPILLRPTARWREAAFGKLLTIPREDKAITEWGNLDSAFAQVAEEIAGVVESLKKKEHTN
jgi:hypothetical protein